MTAFVVQINNPASPNNIVKDFQEFDGKKLNSVFFQTCILKSAFENEMWLTKNLVLSFINTLFHLFELKQGVEPQIFYIGYRCVVLVESIELVSLFLGLGLMCLRVIFQFYSAAVTNMALYNELSVKFAQVTRCFFFYCVVQVIRPAGKSIELYMMQVQKICVSTILSSSRQSAVRL